MARLRAYLARAQYVAHAVHQRVVSVVKRLDKEAAAVAGEVGECARLAGVARNRLFDQHVLPSAECSRGPLVMQSIDEGYVHGLNVGVGQHRCIISSGTDGPIASKADGASRIARANRDHLDAVGQVA